METAKTCSRCATRFATDLVERDGRRFCELCLDQYTSRDWPNPPFKIETTGIDGQGEKLPHVPQVSPRFRLNHFIAWAEQNPARLHQVAAAVLRDQGLTDFQFQILRTFPRIKLTDPAEFYREFGPIDADQGTAHRANPLFDLIVEHWIKAPQYQPTLFPVDGSCEDYARLKLRAVAAMILFENGFRLAEIAFVLGWANKGTASRAIESARVAIRESIELN